MITYRGHDPVTCPSREWSVNCSDRVYTVGVGRLQGFQRPTDLNRWLLDRGKRELRTVDSELDAGCWVVSARVPGRPTAAVRA